MSGEPKRFGHPTGLSNTAHFLDYARPAGADIDLWYNALMEMLPQSPLRGTTPREDRDDEQAHQEQH